MTVWNGDRINGHKVETTFSATGWARQDDGSLVVDFATATREQMACPMTRTRVLHGESTQGGPADRPYARGGWGRS